ncbi:MAG: glycoside hydrolase N-terminal domain-containing protein [Armatimonadetes bacterium]|nr:glycoside hydrolase N-terminal domain-containing protein [Armatimonadota bacterium]
MTKLLAAWLMLGLVASASADQVYLDLAGATRVSVGWGKPTDRANLSGGPLAIGGTRFRHGLTLHAPAELVYQIDPADRWLTFYAGVSADMTDKGSVTVQVWLDGRQVFETPVLRIRQEPVYVHLPLGGAKELRLVGTDAGDGIAADHIALGNLRLSRDAAEPATDLPVPLTFVGEAPPPPEPTHCLWYRRPAERWLEALPIGNGRVGAMVFGGPAEERLALNEITFWSGAASDQHDNPEAPAAFAQIRELFRAGRYAEAQPLIGAMLGRQGNYGSNLPAGDLLLSQSGIDGPIGDYRRELDLDQALARTAFAAGGVRYQREMLASHPAGLLALRLTADKAASISFALRYDGGRLPCQTRVLGPDTLEVTGHAYETVQSDGKCGVAYRALIRLVPTGGRMEPGRAELKVTGADAVTVLVALRTDYAGRDAVAACDQEIASARDYAAIRAAHIADHQPLYRRVTLDLGGLQAANTPTDARHAALRAGGDDPQLCALFYQYARYLTIAGSRADSPLPMHLQGLWNDNLACNMGWTCDFHLDINTQQNYWTAESGNLSECTAPLFRLIESLQAPGHRTAKATYGLDQGWVCHVFTNAWGYTAPGWGGGWGLHVTGGAWIATHLWEHYLYTGDRDFLARQAWPVLRGAAEFYLAYLFTEPRHGHLVAGPSVSPERGGEAGPGSVHDRAVIAELFGQVIAASRALEVEPDLRARVEAALAKLPPYEIGRNQQLLEWPYQDDGGETSHRHTSHLVGLFPFDQITPGTTPELARAAARSLQLRMDRPDWEDVEWSAGNAVCYQARLRDGEAAHRALLGLLREDTDTDLLTFSRGGIAGAPQNIFVLDGNTSGAAGLAEMLMQSHGGKIELLPALPKAWANGRVTGLRARGGATVDITWRDGKVVEQRVY